MTGNIVGEPIDEFVAKQIDTRQKIYGGGFNNIRTPQQLSFFNSRTSFVKLLSSVNIGDDFKPNSEELKEILKDYKGNKLAQNFILFNGVSSLPTTTPSFSSGYLLNNYQNYAYGIGGYEQGLRPMPGIISINVKNETRGSLKTATINLKAWNRVQFEIIDVLYLRLGYTLLLEWGNNIYFKDPTTPDKFESNPFSLETDFLQPTGDKVDYETILEKIQTNRKNSCGNYDALDEADDDKDDMYEAKKKDDKKKKEDEKEMKEAIETINALRNELNETNLLNAKLLYVNKIFKAKNLNDQLILNWIKCFDLREVTMSHPEPHKERTMFLVRLNYL